MEYLSEEESESRREMETESSWIAIVLGLPRRNTFYPLT